LVLNVQAFYHAGRTSDPEHPESCESVRKRAPSSLAAIPVPVSRTTELYVIRATVERDHDLAAERELEGVRE
jgi:hypothetical protein